MTAQLRPATKGDVPALAKLVDAAYGHYVARLGGRPRPMTDDYAEVLRSRRVTVAEREGQIVLDQDDRDGGFGSVRLYTHERMVEYLALYERIGYVEYERRRHGAAVIVHLRKTLA